MQNLILKTVKKVVMTLYFVIVVNCESIEHEVNIELPNKIATCDYLTGEYQHYKLYFAIAINCELH